MGTATTPAPLSLRSHATVRCKRCASLRQGAKRKKFPAVLSASEGRQLLAGLRLRTNRIGLCVQISCRIPWLKRTLMIFLIFA